MIEEEDEEIVDWHPSPAKFERYLTRELELGRINVAVLLARRYRRDELLEPGVAMSPATVIASLASIAERPITELERREISRRHGVLRFSKEKELRWAR